MINLLLGLLSLLVFGCDSNPYSKDGQYVAKKPDEQRAIEPAIAFSSDALYEFSEGVESTYPIILKVPSGKPIIEVEGLPEGASFDPSTSKVQWKPGYDVVDDPTNPYNTEKRFKVRWVISSTTEPDVKIVRYSTFLVKSRQRKFAIEMDNEWMTIYETQQTIKKFKIVDDDYPNSTHNVFLEKEIPGVKIVPDADGPLSYQIVAEVGAEIVKTNQDCATVSYCDLKVENQLIVVAPNGQKRILDITATVKDSRQVPSFVAPESLALSGDSFFEFEIEDPNQEMKPVLNISRKPIYGQFNLSYRDKYLPGDARNNWTTIVMVNWSNVPDLAKGMTELLSFSICNWKEFNDPTNCVSKSMILNIDAGSINPSQIIAKDWGLFDLKYVRQDENFKTKVDIVSNPLNPVVDVIVSPRSLAKEVFWEQGVLHIKTTHLGKKIFTLIAIAADGSQVSRPFQYEVISKDWHKTVLLVEKSKVTSEQDLIGKDFIDRHDPVNSPFDKTPFMFRQNLILSSTYNLDYPDPKFLDENCDTIPNIFILGLYAYQVKGKVIDELKSYGVVINETLASTNSGLKMENFQIDFTAIAPDFYARPRSRYDVGVVSYDTMGTISVTANSTCKVLAKLNSKNLPDEFVVGVECPRAKGGSIVVFTFAPDQLSYQDFLAATFKDNKELFYNWFRLKLN